jgi:hypothetical protein
MFLASRPGELDLALAFAEAGTLRISHFTDTGRA